ncbi:hypothetical protein TREMEDRAFT_24823, partial [Tremella mesenterica DSM 1558]|uniref:uncharacterized protein n=1 Tax=Tremella mesenterica (strain ATCC 24925 / CBS 8224 / DSM 1558 / NBRC 9311 / NRRL Y-6157 / RJB 2259-6 / UBC 559-6) TaxID=578456 RepID=UPI0003F49B26
QVYELRASQWFDRGTGHCRGVYDGSQNLALIIVEIEDSGDRPSEGEGNEGPGGFVKDDEFLLTARVEKEDIYSRQQDTLIVWTEPESNLDIALSFQDAEGCEDIWQFICDVQKHLNGLPHEDQSIPSSSSPMAPSPPLEGSSDSQPPAKLTWQPPTLANIRSQEMMLRMQAKSPAVRERVVAHIINEVTEDLESLDDLHALCALMQTIILFNDNGIFEYILQDDVFLSVIGMLEYDPDFPTLKASYRQFYQDTARFRQIVEIKDATIRTKIHQTYRLLYLKDVVLARMLDDPTFNILNGYVFFNQADIIAYIQHPESNFLPELLNGFQSLPLDAPSNSSGPPSPLDDRKRDVVLFLHQLMLMGKGLQLPNRLALYRNLIEHNLLIVCEWAFRRSEAQLLHPAAEILTLLVEHDVNGVRVHVLKEEKAKRPTLITEMISLLTSTKNLGLMSQMAESMRILLDTAPEESSFLQRKEGHVAEIFTAYFYESCSSQLFKPISDLPNITTIMDPPFRPTREQSSLIQHLVELLSFCVLIHAHRASYFILSNPISPKVVSLLHLKHKPLRHATLRFIKACLKTPNHFIHRYFVKNDLLGPVLDILEKESGRDNMLSSACMDVLDLIRRENVKPVINYLFETYRTRLDSLSTRPFLRPFIIRLIQRWEQNNEPPPPPPPNVPEADTSARRAEAEEEDYFNASDEEEIGPKLPTVTSSDKPPKRRPRAQGGPPPKRNIRSSAPLPISGGEGSALGLDYDDGSDSDSSGAASPRLTPTTPTTTDLDADLSSVAMRMRSKRQEEEEEDEGFAGLLVGAKRREVEKNQQRPATATPQSPVAGGKDTKREGTPISGRKLRMNFGAFGKKLTKQ